MPSTPLEVVLPWSAAEDDVVFRAFAGIIAASARRIRSITWSPGSRNPIIAWVTAPNHIGPLQPDDIKIQCIRRWTLGALDAELLQ